MSTMEYFLSELFDCDNVDYNKPVEIDASICEKRLVNKGPQCQNINNNRQG